MIMNILISFISAGIIQWLEFFAIVNGGSLVEWKDE